MLHLARHCVELTYIVSSLSGYKSSSPLIFLLFSLLCFSFLVFDFIKYLCRMENWHRLQPTSTNDASVIQIWKEIAFSGLERRCWWSVTTKKCMHPARLWHHSSPISMFAPALSRKRVQCIIFPCLNLYDLVKYDCT